MPAARYWDGTKWADLSLGTLGGQYVSFLIGDGLGTSFTLIHRLGSRNVMVACYRTATPWDEVEVDVERTDLDTVTVRTSPTVPASGELTVVVAAPGTQAALNITMDTWHQVGAAGEPAFVNGWVNYGGAQEPVSFRKYPDGRVAIRGLLNKGGANWAANETLFTLPVGYRPLTQIITNAESQSGATATWGPAGININPNGTVQVGGHGGATNPVTWLSLTGISFDTESVLQTASVAAQPLDAVHIVGNPGEPAFQNGWVNYGSAPYVLGARFRKFPDGRVRVAGIVKSGTLNQPVFTLPLGYRPPTEIVCAVWTGAATPAGAVTLRANGDVICGTSNAYQFLDGIEFDTESVNGYATASVPFLPITMDQWHTVGAAGEPAFQGTWGGATAEGLRFRKTPDGRVYVRGNMSGGTAATTVFTLPAGYRPPRDLYFTALAGGGAAGNYTAVIANGNVVQNMAGGWIDLSFDTESVLQTASVAAQPLDTIHYVGAAGEPAFQGAWVNHGSYSALHFRKFPDGRVRITGAVKGGTGGSVCFYLPPGYRPPAARQIPIVGNNAFTYVVIGTDGSVTAPDTTMTQYDSVEFDTESVTGYTTGSFPFLPITQDSWHTVGATGEPGFSNAWVSYDGGSTFQVPGFRKLPDGRVQLRGQAKSGTGVTAGSIMFTLPPGYRPSKALRFGGVEQGAAGPTTDWQQCNIYPDGTVVAYCNTNAIFSLDGIEFDTETVQQTASVAAQPLDAVHLVGASGEPAFQNSWVNDGGVYGSARFRKYPDGRVRVAGAVKGGANGSIIFTLPVGYRPPTSQLFTVYISGGTGLMIVGTDGTLTISANVGTPGTRTSFDGVEFDTEAVANYATGVIPSVTGVVPSVKDYGSGGVSASVPGGGWTATETGGGVISHVITPQVDCWWPCSLNCLARVADASWQRLECRLAISPADVDGNTVACGSIMHHSGACDFNECSLTRSFKLAKGVTYTLTMNLYVVGGTWAIYRHPSHMWLAHDGIRPR